MPRRPNHAFPNAPGLIRPPTPRPLPDPQFDPEGFDELVRNRGIRWLHHKAAYCPNVLDLEVQEHDPSCRDCENGYLFFETNCGQPIMGVFQQNKLERLYEINGLWETGDAVVTFTSFADGPKGEVSEGPMNSFKVGDKLTCLDYTFDWQERVEHSPSGTDRLKYPAVDVEFVADVERRYMRGTDFELTPEGHVQWLPAGKRPKLDNVRNKGGIFTIVYSANPVFYVMQILHEIRATKGVSRKTGNLETIRLPQQLLIRRDYMFAHPADKKGPDTARAPRSGTLSTPE
jgi:hypothetical protein